jgi:hypothetical protein
MTALRELKPAQLVKKRLNNPKHDQECKKGEKSEFCQKDPHGFSVVKNIETCEIDEKHAKGSSGEPQNQKPGKERFLNRILEDLHRLSELRGS